MFHEVLPNLCRSLGLGDGGKDDTEAVIMEKVRVGSWGRETFLCGTYLCSCHICLDSSTRHYFSGG